MQIENWQIDKVKPYTGNPRINDDAVKYVANSIKSFGFKQPIVVDGDGVIIVGHTRLKAAKKLGFKQVPVLVAKDLAPEKVKAYRLADNKTNELSDWDDDLLLKELDDIQNIDMSDFGFDDDTEIEEDEDDISDKLMEKFQVVVDCQDEEELQETFEKLKGEGYECSISTL